MPTQKRNPGSSQSNRAQPTLACLAPYSFVPVCPEPILVGGWRRVSHDVPFRGALSGWLDVDVTAQTPIFTRSSRNKAIFFSLPDGRPAIPGTTLRGMLRAVVEIAAFGKMGRVNEHFFGFRDLYSSAYTGRLTEAGLGKTRVRAGWLRLREGDFYSDHPAGEDGSSVWEIRPCSFAKVEYRLLVKHAEAISGCAGGLPFNPGRKQTSVSKYQQWGTRPHGAWATLGAPDPLSGIHTVDAIDLQADSLGPGAVSGSLVFTGQPMNYTDGERKKKHHDFFFYGPPDSPLRVSFDARRSFSLVHSNAGEQHKLDGDPNPEWNFWLSKLRTGGEVPVFFITDKTGAVEALGLAMMFRLATATNTREVVANAQAGAFDVRPDFADLLFGRAGTGKGDDLSLRGRVSIEPAVLIGDSPNTMQPVSGVLGTPRASYYPCYLQQGQSDGANPPRVDGRPQWKTYMDQDAKARGWKRYPRRRTTVPLPAPPTNALGETNVRISSAFSPLPSGTRFRARIHVHNLRPLEMGALLWALDFGGRPACWHQLGLAKAFGYGSVTLQIQACDLIQSDGGTPVDGALSRALAAFVQYMEKAVAGWGKSRQLFQLIYMATPADETRASQLRHMRIQPNEFTEAKKQGAALPPPGDEAAYARFCEKES